MSDSNTKAVGTYKSEGPGKGNVTVEGFILQRNAKNPDGGIYIKVMRKAASDEQPLRYWPKEGNLDKDGFIFIPIERLHQERRSLTINLESDVIDPMAWAASEEFVLRIKGKDYPSGADKQFVYEFGVANGSHDRCVTASSSVPLEKDEEVIPVQHESSPKTEPTHEPASAPAAAAALSGAAPAAAPSGAAVPPVPPVPPASPVPEPPAAHQAPAAAAAAPASGGSNKMMIIAAAAIAGLAVLGVGGYFLWSMLNAKPEYKPCDLGEAGRTDSEIISGCLSSKPADADLQNLLAQSIKNERCEIVLRLLRTKGRAADGGNYAYIYSVYSDPSSQYSSKCISKSDSDHKYWAERLKGDKNFNPEAAQKVLEQIAQ